MARRKIRSRRKLVEGLRRKYEGEDPAARQYVIGQSGRVNVFGARAGFATIDTKIRARPVIEIIEDAGSNA